MQLQAVAPLAPNPAPPSVPTPVPAGTPSTPPSTGDVPPGQPDPGAPAPAGPRDWDFFDQTTATDAIVAAIDGAKHVVDAEFFAITNAGKGARLCGALVAAAKRGVEVNLVADQTSLVLPPFGNFIKLRRELQRAGGTVIVNSRLPGSNDARRHVDHRKVVSVDGTTSFIGGMNFTPISDAYHDSMVRLTGAPAARVAAESLDRWRRLGGAVSDAHAGVVEAANAGAPKRDPRPDDLVLQVNAPEQARFELSDSYRDLIRGAQKRIWITTPGLSDVSLMDDITAAAKRGVDVRIVTSGTPPLGVPLFTWVGRSHLKRLMEAGGAGFEIPEVLHRKALVVDDTTVLSSYNVTERSRKHDHEIGLRTSDPEFVRSVADVIATDVARANELSVSGMTGYRQWIGDLIAQRLRLSY